MWLDCGVELNLCCCCGVVYTIDWFKNCFLAKIFCKTKPIKKNNKLQSKRMNTAVHECHIMKIFHCVKYNFQAFFCTLTRFASITQLSIEKEATQGDYRHLII